jgi:hypothetical protein
MSLDPERCVHGLFCTQRLSGPLGPRSLTRTRLTACRSSGEPGPVDPTAALWVTIARRTRRLVRRATPAALRGVAGQPTIVSAESIFIPIPFASESVALELLSSIETGTAVSGAAAVPVRASCAGKLIKPRLVIVILLSFRYSNRIVPHNSDSAISSLHAIRADRMWQESRAATAKAAPGLRPSDVRCPGFFLRRSRRRSGLRARSEVTGIRADRINERLAELVAGDQRVATLNPKIFIGAA